MRACPRCGGMVVIWVNGTFGVGKTTTAVQVVAMSDQLRLVDPEDVVFLLRNNLPDHDVTDFQQLEPWRSLVPVVAHEICRYTGQTLVAVQTVLNENYWDQLKEGFIARGHVVIHVLLDADPVTLHARIDADTDGVNNREWRHRHVDTYGTARSWLMPAADLTIDTTLASPDTAAHAVYSHIKGVAAST